MIIIIFTFVIVGCNNSTRIENNQILKTQNTSIMNNNANEILTLQSTDYSKSEHWLYLPTSIDKSVDVFYLYPTSWQKVNKNDPNICDIDNPLMIKGSKLAFERQATAFENVSNIYAPFYRQVDAAYSLALTQAEQEKILSGIPKSDVLSAFDYYIKHYNNGRPFMLAGHSQGSNMLLYILSEYMKKNPDVYKRMIAAYVIGYSVTNDYIAKNPHLKFAEGPSDTRVIISYNTEAPTIPRENPVVLPGALVINPITWTREETLATAKENKGSLGLTKNGTPILDKNGEILPIKNYADARVDKAKGVLICSTLDESKLVLGFGPGIYHSYDYPLYYFNIRENAELRIKNYINK